MKAQEAKIEELKAPEDLELKKSEAEMPVPFFVEAERMLEKFAEISKETAHKAFEFFRERGGRFGHDFDDWFNAEAELLRFVPVEITESNGTVKVTADVAGFKPEEVEISLKDNVLMISGETAKREDKKEENVVFSDFKSNRFFRQLTLPMPVNADYAKAEVKDGMLSISLPKSDKANEPTKITVSAG